jgi:hypothetical protein
MVAAGAPVAADAPPASATDSPAAPNGDVDGAHACVRTGRPSWRFFDQFHLREESRERSTINNYEQHLRLHILPVMGRQKIGKLGEDVIAAFRKYLQASVDSNDKKMTRTLARSVWVTFKSLLRHARLAHLAQNVKGFSCDPRDKRKLEIGKDVPSPAANGSMKPRLVIDRARNASEPCYWLQPFVVSELPSFAGSGGRTSKSTNCRLISAPIASVTLATRSPRLAGGSCPCRQM